MRLISVGHLMSNNTASDSVVFLDARPAQENRQTVLSVGKQLASHRRALGLSIEQVAEQLKLAPRQIEAIEADNHAAMPCVAILRGFIRAYAKLLKVDSVPLLATIANEVVRPNEGVPLKQIVATPFSETSFPSMNRYGKYYKWQFVLLFFVVLLIAVGVFWMRMTPTSFFSETSKKLTLLSQSTLHASMSEVKNVAITNGVSVVDESTKKNIATELVPVIAPAPVPTPVASSSPVSVVTSFDPLPVLPALPAIEVEKNNLVLKLRQDSWIEVKTASNSTLISRLVKAGSTESFDMKEPLFLSVGNISGVDATLRGIPIELKNGNKKNIVRLSLK
jgi:cytoskeleton protein RodZ